MESDKLNYPHWLEISRTRLISNLKIIRKQIRKSTKIMAMVKANAYGHGLTLVAPVIAPHVEYFGVHSLQEAQTLASLHLKPRIFIASPVNSKLLTISSNQHFEVCVPSLTYFKSIAHLPISIHLKINTGMNRLGIVPDELNQALIILKHSRLKLTGIYTHFHSADTNPKATRSQLKIFNQVVQTVKNIYPQVTAHCANSAAIFNYPESHLDLVRPGLAIYGYGHSQLTPALSWKSSITQTRHLPTNSIVGYSAKYQAKNSHYMGVLPLGYSDGLDRKLSNTGRVFINNRYYPIIGRISMNLTTVKLGNWQIQKTPVEILGPHISADELAAHTNTINYEIISGLNPLIPRQLV